MRALCAIAVAACGGPVAPQAPVGQGACSGDALVLASRSSMRVRHGARAYIPLGVADGYVTVADTSTPGAVLVRWLAYRELEPVVTIDIEVSPRPGERGDPTLLLLPGYPLGHHDGAWIPVPAAEGVATGGYVPSTVRGMTWEEGTNNDHRIAFEGELELHRAASLDAPVVARVHAPAALTDGARITDGLWSVTAIADHAVLRGYTPARPRVPRPPPSAEAEIEIDLPPTPAPEGKERRLAGACLYDQPLGRFAGMVTGAIDAEIAPARLGWVQVVLHAATGDTVLYARGPLQEAARPDRQIDFVDEKI